MTISRSIPPPASRLNRIRLRLPAQGAGESCDAGNVLARIVGRQFRKYWLRTINTDALVGVKCR